MVIDQNHKKKRKSLADRINEQGGLSDEERRQEKDLLEQVNTANINRNKSEPVYVAAEQEKSAQVSERSGERSLNQVVERVSEQSPNRSINQVSKKSSERSLNQVAERASEQEINRSSEQEVERTIEQVPMIAGPDFNPPKKPHDLTFEQFQVLHFIYFNRPFKVQSKKGIAIGDLLKPSMTASNVRNRINSLIKKGYIKKPRSINDGIKQGSTCTVKLEKCVPLFGSSGIDETDQVIEWSSGREIKRSSEQVVKRSKDQPETSYICSSSFIKLTTTGISEFENDPDLSYWRNCNLTLTKIDEWLKQFPVSEFQMLQSLRFAQFDLTHNGKEKKITGKNPVSWFEGALKNLGGVYTKPTNFRTRIEIDIEEEEKLLQDQQKQLQILKEKRAQSRSIKAELWFFSLTETEQKELMKKAKGLTPQQRRNFESPATKIAIRKLFDEKP